MNREIKFRAYDKEEKTFEYFDLGALVRMTGGGNEYLLFASSRKESVNWEEIPYTNSWNKEIMQFTGLLDKKGNEIYEGDIVRFENLSYDPAEGNTPYEFAPVIFNLGTYQLNEEFLYEWPSEDLEVIGNIYENPELLTKSND